MTEDTTIPKHIQSSNTSYKSISVPDVYSTNLGNPTKIVIENRNILYLDYCPIIIVLYEWIVIPTGVKGDPHIPDLCTNPNINTIIYKEIKLTIGIHRKRDTAFIKNK